jgi:type IV pilus assembly protein PilQ
VPWDEALDFIMMTKGLEKFESGNVILVAPIGKVKEYKEKQEATEKVVEQLEPLATEYIKINYARAENFRNLLNGLDTGAFGSCGPATGAGSGAGGSQIQGSLLTGGGQGVGGQGQVQAQAGGQIGGGAAGNLNDQFRILSARGSAVVDARTNTLIVRETPKRLEEAKKLIRRLDVPVRQVMIEARIVIANNDFQKELGVRFGVAKQATLNKEGGKNSRFGLGGSGTSGSSTSGLATVTDTLVDLGTAGNPYGALGMTLARAADYVLNLEIQALQDQNRGELLSNPRVMTSDRCQASIKQGVQIAYQTSSANTGPVTQLVDAVLQLDVLPQITPSGSVVMTLNITKDAPLPNPNGPPSINTRSLETNVHVMDGETVVLGGVFEDTINNNVNKVPFFGDLPAIGFLFNRKFNQDFKTELLIFITPKIIKDNAATY